MKIIVLTFTLASLLLAGGCARFNSPPPAREWPEWGTQLATVERQR